MLVSTAAPNSRLREAPMTTPSGLTRRHLLAGAAAAGTLSIGKANAQPRPVPPAAPQPGGGAMRPLPARGNFVVRNGYVLTMDRALNDIEGGDVHVVNGMIRAVGKALDAPGAETIDGRDMIVLPGFVETHWHMWNTLLRSMSGDKREFGYFPTSAGLGKVYQPDDMYQGTRLSCLEAIWSGITTVHSWCHNIRSPAYAEADLRALRESGLRARFSYGTPQGHPAKQTIDLADLERLHGEWPKYANEGLITLGLAWRGLGGNSAANAIPPEVYGKEVEVARRLGLPISVHASGSRGAQGQAERIGRAGLLDKDMQIIHANFATDLELQMIKNAGASISMSPYTELRIGFGMLHTAKFLGAGIPVGLSVDTTVLSGNADMFAIMKVIQNVENGESENEFKLPARRVLELATSEGARSMGIDDRTGSLTPGKRADLIMVSTREPNIGVFTDPAHMIVTAAEPSNVDTVVVDGRILKRGGKITAMDVPQVLAQARAANLAVRKRANWW
jgi:cytosine/adenosine deaminase-related metal-dependent hydrolase